MEISIAGAGPAGLSAAINLARAGFRVKVYEKRKEVGARHPGDLQALENYCQEQDIMESLADMNLPTGFFSLPFHEIDLYDGRMKRSLIRSSRPGFYLIKRGIEIDSFDQALKKAAIEAGADFVLGHQLSPEKADIVATGAGRALMVAAGVTFRTDHPDRIACILSDSLAPRGYAYMVIAKEHGTIGTVLFNEYSRAGSLRLKTVEAFATLYPLGIKDQCPFVGIGDFNVGHPLERDGRLYVGEAAGLQDYWFGFGIRYAVTSGYLAARAIIEGKSYPELLSEGGLRARARSSLADRFAYELLGESSYTTLIRRWAGAQDILGFMRRSTGPSCWKRLLFPLAAFFLGRKRDLFRDGYPERGPRTHGGSHRP